MALYLVQHGKSLSKEQDPEQGLSQEGYADVNRIAEVAAGYGVRPAAIRHSGKKRARQTAEIFAEALLGEMSKTEPISGIDPLDDVAAVANTLKTGDNLMLVGHLPFMERLTGFLDYRVGRKACFQVPERGDRLPGQGPGRPMVVHKMDADAQDRISLEAFTARGVRALVRGGRQYLR